MSASGFVSKPLACALILLLLSAIAAGGKLAAFGTTVSSDSIEYLQTAKSFAGVPGIAPAENRILKPLAPLVVAALHPFLDFQTALLFQAVLFYLAFAVAMFLLAREFLGDDVLALLTSLMAALSYPMLKYGVDVLTETGAMFFVVLSLYLTLQYLRAPTWKIFIANVLVVSIGFLWKEYSVVAGATLGAVVLFHPQLSAGAKARFIGLFAAIFAAIHIPWQLFVYKTYGFSYFTWYHQNAGPGFASEFTLKNVIKSTAAVLGIAWLLVPFGARDLLRLDTIHRRFSFAAVPFPFIGYVWGYISSRLLYVLAPPFLLIAALPLRSWSRLTQYLFTALVISANLVWLILSYSVKL